VAYLTLGAWPPPPAQPLTPAPLFGGNATLLGYDLPNGARVNPGDTVQVNLYWLPQGPFAADLTTFVHLVGPDGTLAAQHDKPPMDGFYPTRRWQPGEPLADFFTLTLPADIPAGKYQLFTGLYDPATGVRVPGESDNETRDAWPIATITVAPED
jgi:hypothetical protein